MENKITTIIFDLGGVLVDWNPVYVYQKFFNNNEQKVNWFLENVCNSSWNIQQDEGRTIEEAVTEKILEFPEFEIAIRLYYNEWHNMFSGSITENVTLFQELKKSGNYKIYALTNWSAEKWDKALELFPFFNNFDGVVVSGKEKTRKPYPKIYNILLNRFQINPSNSFFIDDNLDNVKAAANLGIQSFHYKPTLNLKKELIKFGIQI